MQRSEASGWSRGSARIAAEEGERADRWGRPGSEGRRRARGAERAGLGCGRWLVGSGAQWGRATRSRASGLSGVLLGRVGNLGRAREGEGVGESGPCGGVKGGESGSVRERALGQRGERSLAGWVEGEVGRPGEKEKEGRGLGQGNWVLDLVLGFWFQGFSPPFLFLLLFYL